ncbi:IS1380 family transposase [Caldalkalibacillus thermarum TA2.A1]|uniref:IS1380 family transposase n=1 Tax=Caldalkalibacillus thermarum (strain TA2.A1) TaxID=986075 RepID=A0A8X8I942_CALTT|nr:IS1380 family transposase [Caldalkalibacillus thermarum]QZT33224.1 IS1380 family transposase [Caldalkalibacillus thermarum TA2.A1]
MRFIIKASHERLTAHSGLGLIGLLLEKTDLRPKLNQLMIPRLKYPLLSHSDIVYAMIGLLAQGKSDFEHIEAFREDDFFQYALQLKSVPSRARLRQRLDGLAQIRKWRNILLDEMVRLPRKAGLEPSAIKLNSGTYYVPIDVDVSPFDNTDTHKEGVSRTYKGCDGYAPLLAYIGREGYGLYAELREGRTHVQKEVDQKLREMIPRAKSMTEKPLLLRMDAGNDALNNLAVCQEEGVHFIIKRNLRRESPEAWLAIAQDQGKATAIREGCTRYTGKIRVTDPGLPQPVYQVFDVRETTIAKDGQILFIPEITVDVYWTDLDEDVADIIDLYHDHATCEQFHSELKTDLDLERLPSGKFATNDLVLCLGLFTYTLLRIISQESLRVNDSPLRKKVQRRRIRTVIQTLITLAAKMVTHARRQYLYIGSRAWLTPFKRLYQAFA